MTLTFTFTYARTLIPINTRMQPCPTSTPNRLSQQFLKITKVTIKKCKQISMLSRELKSDEQILSQETLPTIFKKKNLPAELYILSSHHVHSLVCRDNRSTKQAVQPFEFYQVSIYLECSSFKCTRSANNDVATFSTKQEHNFFSKKLQKSLYPQLYFRQEDLLCLTFSTYQLSFFFFTSKDED